MAKPTYEELFKSYMRCEEDREELILENDYLKDRINKVIELLERYNDRENNYYVPVMETIDILKGEDE